MTADEDQVERVARAIDKAGEYACHEGNLPAHEDMMKTLARAAIAAMPEPWRPIESAPRDQMFIWAYPREGIWSIGLAYRNVSGGWSDAYGQSGPPQHATHCMPLPEPPR